MTVFHVRMWQHWDRPLREALHRAVIDLDDRVERCAGWRPKVAPHTVITRLEAGYELNKNLIRSFYRSPN